MKKLNLDEMEQIQGGQYSICVSTFNSVLNKLYGSPDPNWNAQGAMWWDMFVNGDIYLNVC